jgi:hypothetical protein
MTKAEVITISIKADTLDAIRKLAVSNYRSISKQIAYMLDNAITAESTKGK